MAGPGRDHKFNAEREKIILEGLAAGLDRKTAAERAGISDRTFRVWIQRGTKVWRKHKPEEPFITFVTKVQEIEGDCIARHVKVISQAADKGDWKAAAWWLERMHPDKFGAERRRIRELEKLVNLLTQGTANAGPVAAKTERLQETSTETTEDVE
jgi:hypothetical protein